MQDNFVKFLIYLTYEYSNNNIQVVARKDTGINEPTDLIDKKVATTKGGGPLFFTHKFLERYGMDISDVKLVHLSPGDMVMTLIKGDIDAFIVFEPSPSVAKKEIGEDKIVTFAPTDLYGETWNIVVMDNFETHNSETIKKFIRALLKAEDYLEKNPAQSLDIVARYSEIDKTLLSDIMRKQQYEVVLNNLIIDYPKQKAEWAIEIGISSQTNIPNYRDLIDEEYLRELKPGAVQI